MKKFFSIILSLLMMCSFTLTACKNNDTPHTCSSKCSVCQLCTDEDCTDSACSNKCQGHGAEHTCESVCPTCGRCTDNSCTETACVNKCQGHTPAPGTHTCESVCPICGNCMDETCTEDECEEKCAGHEQAELTAAQFVANTSNYLTDANEGISAAAAALGSSVELSYAEPFFPISPMSARATTRSSGVKMLSARTYNAGNSIVLLSDTKDEMMMCGKCGEVEVTVEQKYCDACKEAMSGQTNPKNYSTGETLEQYIIFNSVARKIQLIVGATEYYTEYDFPFPNEYELTLIGTVKFEGELTKLLKEIEDYELSANADDFYVIEEPRYADGAWNPEIGNFDKELGGQTLIGKEVRGYKLEGNTLITSTYYVSYDYMNNNEESISEEVFVEYTMDGNNFYYEKYKMEEGQKVVVDMFDIIKEEPNENTLGDVYYVQMTLNGEEEITGMPAVYFEEAVDIADQWQRYVNEKMGTGYHAEVPTKVYLNGKIHKIDQDVMYEMYYFRDYDYAVAGYESTCELQTQIDEYWDGIYIYEYTRGNSAPLPESWENGFDTNLGANLEGMIEDLLYGKYAETLVYRASGNVQMPREGAKYYPFELKESSATLDINDSYEIIASSADEAVWSVSSSNEEVATVSGLTVQSGSVEGEAIITVQRNNLVRYFHVLVRNRLVYDGPEEMTIRLGTTAHAVFNAYSNQNDVLEFWSDNEEIVTIDEYGVITAHKKGDTTVWVKTQDGDRFEKMFVHVVNTVDITSLYLPSEYGIGESYDAPMHLMGLGGISVTYDTVLDANTEYYMVFDGLDIEGYVYGLRINGTNYADQSDVVVAEVYDEWTDDAGYHYDLMKDYRSVTFKNAGTYKLEYWTYTDPIGYQYVTPDYTGDSGVLDAKQLVLLEINVTVDTNLPYRYDETTNTFFVKDYEGLLAWYDAQQIDRTTNVTLEADIVMPTENFLFDLDGNGVNESNWGLGVNDYIGTVNGNSYAIYNLTMISDQETLDVGFIYKLLSSGVVKNLTMKDSNLRGSRIGGVVVYAREGASIVGCVNYSTLTAGSSAGGIVAKAYKNVKILGCVNYGDVVGKYHVSGICAHASNVRYIIGCANYGDISGINYTNGIIGLNDGAIGATTACFNAGNIMANGGFESGYAITHRWFRNSYFTVGSGEYTGTYQSLNEEVHYVDGTNCTFDDVITALNAKIKESRLDMKVRCDYMYVLNTDPATSEAYPLILQEVTDAQ